MIRNLPLFDQDRLFAAPPKRFDLASKAPPVLTKVSIRILRNQVVEPILSLTNRFLSNFGLEAEWEIGPYDDTLRILDFGTGTVGDATVILYDLDRINESSVSSLCASLELLVDKSTGPIFFVDILSANTFTTEIEEKFSNHKKFVYVRDSDPNPLSKFREERLLSRNGSSLSAEAMLRIAQNLGLQVLPEVYLPPLKCLVLDLDNTMYDGVLGEDGVEGIRVSESHSYIGDEITRLKSQGVLIAVASKNDYEDVNELVTTRTDLPFTASDLAAIRCGWASKSQMIEEIARELNLGLESIAIIDDNISELLQINNNLPEVYTLHARDVARSLRALKISPRFSSHFVDSTKGIRIQDIRANKSREALQGQDLPTVDLNLRLKTRVKIHRGSAVDVDRCYDLFLRTNQFNLTLNRSKSTNASADIAMHGLISGSVEDIFSDSGVVAAAAYQVRDSQVVFSEFVISCRALGRGLESVFLAGMVDAIQNDSAARLESVVVNWARGPRNEPALSWLSALSNSLLFGEKGAVEIGTSALRADLDSFSELKHYH